MSMRVLICDDAMFMRTVVSSMFQEAGHTIVGEAETGDQAIEKYRELNPDIVTMDVVMPGRSGIDTVREIVNEHPDARVIMCTAMGQEALVNQALEAGARGFLVKPFDRDRLMSVVAEACEEQPNGQVAP